MQRQGRLIDLLRDKRALWLGAALMIITILVLSWWPLIRWQPPQLIANGAERMEAGGLRFASTGIARSGTAPQWLPLLVDDPNQSLTVFLRVKSYAAYQGGPARILTLSRNNFSRNLTLGQEGSDLILRLRGTNSDRNGLIAFNSVARVAGVFARPDLREITLVISPKTLLISIDGRVAVEQALSASPFQAWNRHYELALGNELTNERPWLGEIGAAQVEAAGTKIDYAASGNLELPSHYWRIASQPRLTLNRTSTTDAVENVFFYLPLGLFLGWLSWPALGWRWAPALFALSILMEAVQIAIPGRTPALSDVIANTLGGVLGLALAYWVLRVYLARTAVLPANKAGPHAPKT
jgi:VanZ family protein